MRHSQFFILVKCSTPHYEVGNDNLYVILYSTSYGMTLELHIAISYKNKSI